MILITQFWNFENPKRKEEIYDCLRKNSMNRYITKIYVFSENGSYMKFQHNKIVPLKAEHRLTYFEMFKTVNQNFSNQICIVANADVYFDESIVKLNHVDYKNKIVALSSYDSNTKLIEDYSIDSWILKSINLPYSEYEIGKSYDDLRLLSSLREYEVELINPSKEIFSYHVDSNKKLKYTTGEHFDYIEPSTLNAKPIYRGDNIEIKTTEVIKEIEIIETHIIEKVNTRNNPKRNPNIIKNNKVVRPTNHIKRNPRINRREIIPETIKTKTKIAIHLHLYYQDLWDEFSSIFKNLDDYEHDIYITLTKGSATVGQTEWIKNKIHNEFANATVIEIENKGLDVGAFLSILEHITANNKSYDYMLKLHTKKSVKSAGVEFGVNWRRQLYKPLIGDVNTVTRIINKMNNNDNIGMSGNTAWISDYQGLNKARIDELKRILNIKTNNKRFIGGTMFWIKYPILMKYFNSQTINKVHTLLETGYFTDYENGTYTHALERILGYIVSDSDKIIDGV